MHMCLLKKSFSFQLFLVFKIMIYSFRSLHPEESVFVLFKKTNLQPNFTRNLFEWELFWGGFCIYKRIIVFLSIRAVRNIPNFVLQFSETSFLVWKCYLQNEGSWLLMYEISRWLFRLDIRVLFPPSDTVRIIGGKSDFVFRS